MPKRAYKSGTRRKANGSSFLELRGGASEDASLERSHAFQKAILAIPAGKVSTYGKIAAASGYPRLHRAVARLLGEAGFEDLPWHRVIGADGTLKTSGASATEQRARLRLEGVRFDGDKIDLKVFLHWSVEVIE